MDFRKNSSHNSLKLISLGGFGKVTSNMFVYEYGPDIVLVDCGIGFPSEDMLGIDLLIPDISYLRDKRDKIRGLVITHGHEDHTGAIAYILPELKVPIYASKLTANLIMDKLAEYQNMPQTVNILNPGTILKLGSFQIESVRISHSIPDATNLIIKTPAGTVYHGSDYKFDFTPVDGVQPDLGRIGRAGMEGVTLLLSDSLGSERRGYTPSEKGLEEMFEREISQCEGKVIMTTMGSNISRFKQAIDTGVRHGRRIAIAGRSIDRNLTVAAKIGFIKLPKDAMIDVRQVRKLPPKNVLILAAGSQAQAGSAVERMATGEHKDVTILPGDKVIFSSDYIPGNESAVQSLIDTLSQLGATVIYSNITDNLHVSGHGSQQDMLLMANLTRPKFFLPIGGTYRHMVQYAKLIGNMDIPANRIMLPAHNEYLEITPDNVRIGGTVPVRNVMVDGLGVGDVGQAVLRDRQHLSEEGIVVAVIESGQGEDPPKIDLISRGFVFAKDNSDLLRVATALLTKAIVSRRGKTGSDRFLREIAADELEKFFFAKTGRRPMIVPVVVEV